MGSNMAEQHPVGFQWVIEAKERGATVMHVDPRYTRTSAMADVHVPLRGGSDIAFLGGIINYILQNGREYTEYVRHSTNARLIIKEEFRDTDELDGLFSGWQGGLRVRGRQLGLRGHLRRAHRRQAPPDGRRLRRYLTWRPRDEARARRAPGRGLEPAAPQLRVPDP